MDTDDDQSFGSLNAETYMNNGKTRWNDMDGQKNIKNQLESDYAC